MYVIPHFSLSDLYVPIIFILFTGVLLLAWWGDQKEKVLSLVDTDLFTFSHRTIVSLLKEKGDDKSIRTVRILEHYLMMVYKEKLAEAKDYHHLIEIIKKLMTEGDYGSGKYGLTQSASGKILQKSIREAHRLIQYREEIMSQDNIATLVMILNKFSPKVWELLPKELGVSDMAHRLHILLEKEMLDGRTVLTRHFLNGIYALVKTDYFYQKDEMFEKIQFAEDLKRKIEKTQNNLLEKKEEEVLA